MKPIAALRALISEKCDSEAALARRIGWSRQRLNRITRGIHEPDLYEAVALAQALGITLDSIADIFLPSKSPFRQQS